MNRLKSYLAILGVFGLGILPGQGALRVEGGGKVPNSLDLQSMTLKPYRIIVNVQLTEQDHAGRLGIFDIAAGVTVTLPRATGSGAIYRFAVKTTVTSVNDIIKVSNTDDLMIGKITSSLVGTPTTVNGWQSVLASAFDTITLNGTTTGGIAGDYIEITDVAEGFFIVAGETFQSAGGATPFSATV